MTEISCSFNRFAVILTGWMERLTEWKLDASRTNTDLFSRSGLLVKGMFRHQVKIDVDEKRIELDMPRQHIRTQQIDICKLAELLPFGFTVWITHRLSKPGTDPDPDVMREKHDQQRDGQMLGDDCQGRLVLRACQKIAEDDDDQHAPHHGNDNRRR